MPLPNLADLRKITLRTAAVLLAAGATLSAAPAPSAADLPDVQPAKGKLLVSIDFESTPVGQIPPGFTKTGSVAVVDDVAHSGKRSLRMDAAANGPRRITVKDEALMKALGPSHWGRLYFKVQLPTPVPAGEGKFPVIHSTLVSGTAQSPSEKDGIEVRVLDTVMGPKGTFQWIYNVQPRSKRPEFGKGGGYKNTYTDQWTLAEWYVDHKTQTYRLFINGQEMKDVSFSKGEGNFEKAEIPAVFESLSFGWNNYQKAEKGFVAWIDDVALAKERIGDQGAAAAAEPPAKRRR
ncbi:MAG TPA: hypothetical protein VF796_28945, partial [Humisphaera sp.]